MQIECFLKDGKMSSKPLHPLCSLQFWHIFDASTNLTSLSPPTPHIKKISRLPTASLLDPLELENRE